MSFRSDFPLPDVEWEPTRPFWAAAARGELAIPRCDACGLLVWYPDRACRGCAGTRHTWTVVSGRGRLYSFSVVRRAFIPAFAADVPYTTGLVALAEDPAVRLVTRIIDCDPAALRIDQALRAVFRPLVFPGIERHVVAPMFVIDA
jgi:uncharacterized OB-fold protein